MSQGRYMKIKASIRTDSEQAKSVLKDIQDGLDAFIKGMEWDDISVDEKPEVTEIEAVFCLVVSGSPTEKIDEILSSVNKLDNGSYAVLICDSDYGVNGEYYCYGAAEFIRVNEPDIQAYKWSTDDCLILKISMPADSWCELLSCEKDDVCDYIEDNEVEILNQFFVSELVSTLVSDNVEDDDISPFDFDEVNEYDEMLEAVFNFNYHEISGETFLRIKDFFIKNTEKLNSLNANITLYFDSAENDNGIYKNEMICPDNYSVLTFKSGKNYFGEESVYNAKIKS